MRGTTRRVFNNIFVQVEGLPGLNFRAFPTADDDFQADGNLHWGVKDGPQYKGGLLRQVPPVAAVRGEQEALSAGLVAHDLFADPRFQVAGRTKLRSSDLRLQKGSPAIDAGVEVPADWPDPLRKQDTGRPDIGALPLGAEPFQAGKP